MNFNQHFLRIDDYMTPRHVWQDIQYLIPPKVIWEPFYGNGQSGKDLESLGFTVIHEPIDFFTHNRGEIIVSNPPFSKLKNILKRLKLLQKPFIIIMPCSKLCTKYFRDSFGGDPDLQIIVPRKRIHFLRQNSSNCNFDCLYYCWRIFLPTDLMFL